MSKLLYGRKKIVDNNGEVTYKDKDYLSYSAMNTWIHSPEQYSKQYFEGAPFIESPEILFGGKIGRLLETRDASMDHIMQYSVPEQKLEFEVEDVKIMGFIDSFSPERNAIIEYKTGKQPWDQNRVNRHLQLDIYSLGVETIFGTVDDLCHLIWMQTERVDHKAEGRVTHADSYEIRLTGEVQTFERVITKDDRYAVRELIVRVAHEIDRAYETFLEVKANKAKAALHGGRVPMRR